jgi:hypothetical protein
MDKRGRQGMTPETKARQQIDQKLKQAGWVIQDMKQLNLAAGVGIAVREYPNEEIVVSLSRQLSWTHFLMLLPIEAPLWREFRKLA